MTEYLHFTIFKQRFRASDKRYVELKHQHLKGTDLRYVRRRWTIEYATVGLSLYGDAKLCSRRIGEKSPKTADLQRKNNPRKTEARNLQA